MKKTKFSDAQIAFVLRQAAVYAASRLFVHGRRGPASIMARVA